MNLRELVEKYRALAGGFGRPLPLAAFGLARPETERLFGVFDEDYHISRFFHFSLDPALAAFSGQDLPDQRLRAVPRFHRRWNRRDSLIAPRFAALVAVCAASLSRRTCRNAQPLHELVVLLAQFVGQAVPELLEERCRLFVLPAQSDGSTRSSSSIVSGEMFEAVERERVPRGHPSDGSFRGFPFAFHALENPFQHARIISEARP